MEIFGNCHGWRVCICSPVNWFKMHGCMKRGMEERKEDSVRERGTEEIESNLVEEEGEEI